MIKPLLVNNSIPFSIPEYKLQMTSTAEVSVSVQVDVRVSALYQKVVKRSINWDDVVPTCIFLAHEAEQFKEMKGAEKLKLVQDVLMMAVGLSDLDAEKKKGIFQFIKVVLPLVVQGAVLVSKSPILLKKIQSWATYFCCCGRK